MPAARNIVFVIGGARSGKSSFAMTLANSMFRKPVYLATAEPGDREMRERIAKHKSERGSEWLCVEQPLNPAETILRPPRGRDGILLDCLTLWLSNILCSPEADSFDKHRSGFLHAISTTRTRVIIVANEVGQGIVPENRLARRFRDLAGWLNQDVARIAGTVVLVTAGLPLVLKGRLPESKLNSKGGKK